MRAGGATRPAGFGVRHRFHPNGEAGGRRTRGPRVETRPVAAPPDPGAPTLDDLASPVSADDARRALHALVAALADAHFEGRVHGALAPRHVVRGPDGLEVHGFGDGPDSRDGAYRAPEVARGAPADAASDIWAAGAIAHRLLTGVPPVAAMVQDEEGGRRVAHGAVESVGAARPDIVKADPELVGIVDRMLDRRPTGRPSARAVRLDLGVPPAASAPDPFAAPGRGGASAGATVAQAQAQTPAPVPSPGVTPAPVATHTADWLPPDENEGRSGRGRLLAILGILVVGGLGAGVAYVYVHEDTPKRAAAPASTTATTAASTATGTLAGAEPDAGTGAESGAAATGAGAGTRAATTKRLVAWANGVEGVLRLSQTGRERARTAERALGICDWDTGRKAARATIANRREALDRLDALDTPDGQVATQRLLARALRASIEANQQRLKDSQADEAAVRALPATGEANDCDGYTPTASQSNVDDRASAELKERFVARWNALPARAKATDWDAGRI